MTASSQIPGLPLLFMQVSVWIVIFMIPLFFVVLNIFHRYSIRWEKDKKTELLKAMLQAQEEERSRIARELHDDYGVRLTTLKLYMQASDKEAHYNPELVKEHALQILDSAIRELRNILFNLSPRALKENGLITALHELAENISRVRHVDFELNLDAFNMPIHSNAEHSFYRICQELINNSMKYASPRNIHISMVHFEENVVFLYEDDGKGFDTAKKSKGYGIQNIAAHVDSMGGNWHLESRPNQGMSMNIEIPYKNIQPDIV
jgi:signal transduction histidine kinase